MELELLPYSLSICHLDSEHFNFTGRFFCVVKTEDEISFVCESHLVPAGAGQKIETGFRALRVKGVLDFSLTGILAKIALPLAQAKISIFAISTFDTDYILVRETALAAAQSALESAGFSVSAST